MKNIPIPMLQMITGAITGEAIAAWKPPPISPAMNRATLPSRMRRGPAGRGRMRVAASAAAAISAPWPNNRAGSPSNGAAVASAIPRICPPNWAREANATP